MAENVGLLAHIRRCNAHDLAGFQPFAIGGVRVGWIRPAVAEVLFSLDDAFERDGRAVTFARRFESFDDRSAVLDEAAEALVAAGLMRKMRDELYGVRNRWSDPPLAAINRGAVEAFGIRAYGVHLNGWRRRADGEIEMWIGHRARDKSVAPGKLDNMVAGGQPLGLSLMQNLLKEAAEEADVPAALASKARPVGCIAYVMESEAGLKPDVMFCYDLEVPQDFTPVNTDGEIEGFEIMSARAAGDVIRESCRFKFNVNLVIIDFLVRHGLLDPDLEPDYAEIVASLSPGIAAL